jgi:RNA polymerase sigma-70 factor (ECF subfamily)
MQADDGDLAGLLAADVRGVFRSVVETYQHRLYSFTYRLTGSPHTAEDIVQETFVRAYVACMTYTPERVRTLKLRPWLYKVALNEFHHHARGGQLHVIPLDLSEGSQALALEDEAAERPELLVESREQRQELESALLQLPERYRIPIFCVYFEHLSYQETAELLDQPVGTVKSAVFRGVRHLRALLATEGREGTQWSPRASNQT